MDEKADDVNKMMDLARVPSNNLRADNTTSQVCYKAYLKEFRKWRELMVCYASMSALTPPDPTILSNLNISYLEYNTLTLTSEGSTPSSKKGKPKNSA